MIHNKSKHLCFAFASYKISIINVNLNLTNFNHISNFIFNSVFKFNLVKIYA